VVPPLHTLLRPWALKRFGAQAPRLRRVIRRQRNPPKQQCFDAWSTPGYFAHSSTGTARGLLRRRIKEHFSFPHG